MAPTISSGSAIRPIGFRPVTAFRMSGLLQRGWLKPVLTIPGATTLARILYWAHCWAITLVAMITPALLMEYMGSISGLIPAMEAILMILPPPFSFMTLATA